MAKHPRFFKILLVLLGVGAGILALLFIAFYLMVEFGGKWSEKERQQFAEECANTTTIDGLYFTLGGFDYHEVDTILVKRQHEGKYVDSFYVHVSSERHSYDSIRNQYRASINKPMQIADTYHFIVPDVQTFVLSDMEMVMWPQYTMFSEGWGCRIGCYTLDNVRFEHDSNPMLLKQGYE